MPVLRLSILIGFFALTPWNASAWILPRIASVIPRGGGSSGGARGDMSRGNDNSQSLLVASSSSANNDAAQVAVQPTLVVGATGRVGRLVVQQLLGQNRPVRALVRDAAKAQQIFGTTTSLEYPPLEIVVADLGEIEEYEDVLDKAVQGCGSIVSVYAFRNS
jgi:hypothetical protein